MRPNLFLAISILLLYILPRRLCDVQRSERSCAPAAFEGNFVSGWAFGRRYDHTLFPRLRSGITSGGLFTRQTNLQPGPMICYSAHFYIY